MRKIRFGGYVFVTWIGDHARRHVHVFRDARWVAKWDLDNGVDLEGKTTRRVRRLIERLRREGRR